MGTVTLRVRSIVWFVAGAVLAVAAMSVFANAWRVDAAPGDTDATFVAITPCRLADTRPAPNRVGPTATLGDDETETFTATGANGECSIPGEAAGLSLNVTALGATQLSFLTFWPDGDRPLAASLNPAPGQPPVPNAVTTNLSATGSFNVYNDVGSVDVVIDVNGYYTKASLRELTQRLAAVEAGLAANSAADAANAAADAANASTNAAADATNAAGVVANASDIAALDDAQAFTVASEPVEFVAFDGDPTEIRRVVVTARVDGRVAVVATGSFYEQDNQQVQCGLMPSVSAPPPTVQTFWTHPPGGNEAMMTASRVFEIGGGETATYFLVCLNSSAGTSQVDSPQLFGIFTASP